MRSDHIVTELSRIGCEITSQTRWNVGLVGLRRQLAPADII